MLGAKKIKGFDQKMTKGGKQTQLKTNGKDGKKVVDKDIEEEEVKNEVIDEDQDKQEEEEMKVEEEENQ